MPGLTGRVSKSLDASLLSNGIGLHGHPGRSVRSEPHDRERYSKCAANPHLDRKTQTGGSNIKLNADFGQRVAVHFDDVPWLASPAAGVERKMLDRIGDEVAWVTTFGRFAPVCAFAANTYG